ncbi:MAG: hypothetical protein HQ523_15240 [Lentisphaerae bacterium]|nr:hypothetical protein [Lentisphaerota bacterium]
MKMTHKATLILLAGLTLSFPAYAAISTANFHGAMNGWGTDAMTLGSGVWRITILSDGNDASSAFLFDEGGDYDPKWGRGDVVSFATVDTAYNNGGNSLFNETTGKYYTFALGKDPIAYQNSGLVIQETSNNPITVSRSGEESGGVMDPGDPNTISVTLSSSTHSEDIYVRYTTDAWSSSQFAAASGAGTAYTATIPGQSRNTSVEYYAFTTTFASPSHANSDLETLTYNTDGANATYTVSDLGNSWSRPYQTVPGTAVKYLSNGSGGYAFNGSEPTAWICTGTQYQGGGDQATPSGLSLYHKKSTDGSWTETTGSSDSMNGNDEFWKVALVFASHGYVEGDIIQYYFKQTYSSGEATTYIYADAPPTTSLITSFDATAKAAPFSFQYGLIETGSIVTLH